LLDDIPESIAIGVSLITGGTVSIVTVAAIFLSNIPESISSSTGMKKANRSKKYIVGLWGSLAFVTAISSFIGYTVFSLLPQEASAVVLAIAAGAILAMIADTMIPEAFEEAHDLAGLITVIGFLIAFLLSKTVSSRGFFEQKSLAWNNIFSFFRYINGFFSAAYTTNRPC
jgi:ZIP family zinc transporter